MNSGYLNFCKSILKKVHFDSELFIREYQKSLSWLHEVEQKQLKSWMLEEFGSSVEELIAVEQASF